MKEKKEDRWSPNTIRVYKASEDEVNAAKNKQVETACENLEKISKEKHEK